MFPTKPSGQPLPTLYELQHLRRALHRLDAVGDTSSPTIADLKRIVNLRINKLEACVDQATRVEAVSLSQCD